MRFIVTLILEGLLFLLKVIVTLSAQNFIISTPSIPNRTKSGDKIITVYEYGNHNYFLCIQFQEILKPVNLFVEQFSVWKLATCVGLYTPVLLSLSVIIYYNHITFLLTSSRKPRRHTVETLNNPNPQIPDLSPIRNLSLNCEKLAFYAIRIAVSRKSILD